MLRKQLKELEISKDNCRIWLGTELSFFGKIWRLDADAIELITFANEFKPSGSDAAECEELATSSRWIIPIKSIVAIGYGWHTLSNKEPTLQFAERDPIFKQAS